MQTVTWEPPSYVVGACLCHKVAKVHGRRPWLHSFHCRLLQLHILALYIWFELLKALYRIKISYSVVKECMYLELNKTLLQIAVHIIPCSTKNIQGQNFCSFHNLLLICKMLFCEFCLHSNTMLYTVGDGHNRESFFCKS